MVILNAFDITLTLPGIAGIILSIGMAVDANVIIFARVKEEMTAGRGVKNSLKTGFHKAMSAIVDGNVTTLAAAVLWFKGSGTVKGFAQTLAIGIIVSMFTALVITRMIVYAFYGVGIRNEKFYYRPWKKERKTIDFLAKKKDATITRKDGKFVITKQVDGVDIDFEANADKLAEVFSKKDWNHKSVVFPMDYTLDKAKHTKKELSAIKDVLGTFTTSYAGSASGRCANVENGASLINGTLLYPGDSFSVYSKVAPFTADNGYHLAGSYSNGQTVQTYGGGICQVSTTLYNAVLRAELNVTERSNHSMTVHYVPLSADAAISGTDKDLKFTNNLDHPVYIQGVAGGSSITFTIYGKEYRASNRKVEYVSETVSTRGPSEKVIKDNTMEEGKRVVESNGRTGYTARLWKVVYIDGKETKRTQVNSSSYMSTPSVVRVGTKKKEVPKPTTQKKDETAKAGEKAEGSKGTTGNNNQGANKAE